MFALPGTLLLLIFMFLRPHEIYPIFRGVPCMSILYAMSLLGLLVDVRLKLGRSAVPAHVRIGIACFIWALITVGVAAPQMFERVAASLPIPIIMFGLVAQGVQSLRAVERAMVVVVVIAIIVGVVATMQAQAPFQCIRMHAGTGAEAGGLAENRFCDSPDQCYVGGEPGYEYLCEKVGPLGTTSIGEGRVRYRGLMQDPNELAVMVGAGMPLSFALFNRRRTVLRFLMSVATLTFGIVAIIYTASRTGQLVAVAVVGVYFIARLGAKGAAIGALIAAPALLLGGRSGEEASTSTRDRLEAWQVGMKVWRGSPVWGGGALQFDEYHYLTAHNAFVLAAAELGFVGLFLWILLYYSGFKIAIMGIRRYRDLPEAAVAYAQARGLLAALSGLLVGSLFLSLTYHIITWMLLGLCGGYYLAVRRHDPDFVVPLKAKDFGMVTVLTIGFIIFMHIYLRLKGYP